MIEQATKNHILAQMREQERSKKAERVTANTLEAACLIVKGQTQLTGVDWASVLIHLEIARKKAQEIIDGNLA